MATLRITFLWEEDEAMSYDELIDRLMSLGAEDISDEEVEPPKQYRHGPKKQKPL
jgi:hypothetical protein